MECLKILKTIGEWNPEGKHHDVLSYCEEEDTLLVKKTTKLFYSDGSVKEIMVVDGDLTEPILKTNFGENYTENLIKVSIGNTVTAVTNNSFVDCPDLEALELSNSIYRIDMNAFKNAPKLSGKLIIPANVKIIRYSAFYNCGFDEVIIRGDKTELLSSFSYCSNLKKITINGNVGLISDNFLYGCNNLETVIINGNVETIRNSSFSMNPKLKEIIINGDVNDIYTCLSSNESLENISISGNVGTIKQISSTSPKEYLKVNSIKSVDYATVPTDICNHLVVNVIANSDVQPEIFTIARAQGWVSPKATEFTVEDAAKVKSIGNAFSLQSTYYNRSTYRYEGTYYYEQSQPKDLDCIKYFTNITNIKANDFLINKPISGSVNTVYYDFDSCVLSRNNFVQAVSFPEGLTELPYINDMEKLIRITVPASVKRFTTWSYNLSSPTLTVRTPCWELSKSVTIVYAGTKAQWDSITKPTNWLSKRNGAVVTLLCTDGKYTL